MSMKNVKPLILVVCGSGIATSTVVAKTIREELSKRGIDVDVDQTDVFSVQNRVREASIIVSICSLPNKDFNIPVVNGVPILTGVRKDKVFDDIVKILKENAPNSQK